MSLNGKKVTQPRGRNLGSLSPCYFTFVGLVAPPNYAEEVLRYITNMVHSKLSVRKSNVILTRCEILPIHTVCASRKRMEHPHSGPVKRLCNFSLPIPKKHKNDRGGKQGLQTGSGHKECTLCKKFNSSTDPKQMHAYKTHNTANCSKYYPDGNIKSTYGSSKTSSKGYASHKGKSGGGKHLSAHKLKKLKKQKKKLTKMVLALNMGKEMSKNKQLEALNSDSSSSDSSDSSDDSYYDDGHCNNTRGNITDSNSNLNVRTGNMTSENPVNSPSTPIKVAN